jgi:uncharacterized protein
MLFKSRQRLTVLERLRNIFWPRVSFARSARYTIKRMMRIQASPHAIAVGCAAGVFASITPLIGVQMAMAGALALMFRGSFAAAMLGTLFGNPVSWPLIWGGTYALGTAMIGQPGSAEASSIIKNSDHIWPVLYPMLLGSIPIGLVSAAVSYGIVAKAVDMLRCRRDARFDKFTTQWAALAAPAWRLW